MVPYRTETFLYHVVSLAGIIMHNFGLIGHFRQYEYPWLALVVLDMTRCLATLPIVHQAIRLLSSYDTKRLHFTAGLLAILGTGFLIGWSFQIPGERLQAQICEAYLNLAQAYNSIDRALGPKGTLFGICSALCPPYWIATVIDREKLLPPRVFIIPRTGSRTFGSTGLCLT